jgi:hypothetical protein
VLGVRGAENGETDRSIVATSGIEPPTFRFSGGSDLRSETFVLVKLDELDASRGFRARGTTGVADTERMKATFNR